MKKLACVFFLLACAALPQAPLYPYRWVYVSRGLGRDQDVEDIRQIARTAAAHGLNGIALAAGLDRLDLQPPAYFERLRQVKQICDELGVEIIPMIFSTGYGGSVIAHDRNLAEGLPVKDALFVAEGAEARLAPDPPVSYVNGSLEEFDGNRVKGYALQDRPGEVSFVDTETAADGAASLRFENLAGAPGGNARLMQAIAVRPYRCYRITAWVRTEGLQPANAFRIQVLATADGRTLSPWDPGVPATAAWRKLTWGFNSAGYDSVRIYAGTWGAKDGRFWVDGFSIEEVGPLNVLRRGGTPITVRGEESGAEYREGEDFAPIADPQLTFRYDHAAPAIRLLSGGRIREGERLRVSWYHGVSINDGQVSVCMSEPKLYEIFRDQARRIHEALAPAKYILSMDEIRAGGSCEACKRRGIGMAEILGDSITQQVAILREVNPEAEVWSWSDMLDPNHNAHGNYYLVDGDYAGSWNYVPRDLGILCWYYAKRVESLAHFSGLGFRTLAGAYYDGDTLENPRGWLEALDATPGAAGIMYTTWQNKYGLLAEFGDLVSGHMLQLVAPSAARP